MIKPLNFHTKVLVGLTNNVRRIALVLVTLVLQVTAITTTGSSVIYAAPCPEGMSQLDCQAIYGPWVDWLPEGAQCLSGSPSPSDFNEQTSGGSVYILGDSITVRSESEYQEGFKAKQIGTYIDASVGRSWDGPGDSSQSKTKDGSYKKASVAVDDDRSAIQSASGIVIALGSNGGTDGNPIDQIISKFRKINGSAPIWWVNVTGTDQWKSANLKSYMGKFNKALSASSSSGDFRVIDWAGAVAPDGDPFTTPGLAPAKADPQGLLADGLHPNDRGVKVLANLVINSVTNGTNQPATASAGTSTCCAEGGSGVATVGEIVYGSASQEAKLPKSKDQITQTPSTSTTNFNQNRAIAWQYFIGKGLSAQQTAGLIGNMHAEAAFQADNAQNDSSWPSGGYGIVQWTGGRRDNLVKAMNDAGIGDLYKPEFADGKLPAQYAGILLGFELDYSWNELNSPYKYKSVFDKLMNMSSYRDTTKLIFDDYEGPGDDTLPDRVEHARQALEKYGASSAGAPGQTIPGSCPDTTGIGTGKGKFTTNTTVTFDGVNKMLNRAKGLTDLQGALFNKYCTTAGNPNGPNCAGWCAHIAAVVWGYNTGSYGSFPRSANGQWQYMKSTNHAHPGDRNPPIGALLYYDTGSAAGHVAVYVGDNMVFSNDILDSGSNIEGGVYITDASKIESVWNATYLGWSEPFYNGRVGFGS